MSASTDTRLGERLGNAFLDAAFFYRATDPAREDRGLAEWVGRLDEDQGAGSMGLIYPAKLPAGIDVANIQGKVWFHPAQGMGGRAREGLEALFARAVAPRGCIALEALLAIAWRRAAMAPAGLAELLGNGAAFPSMTPTGRPCNPPGISAPPLPCKPVMEERNFAAAGQASGAHRLH